MSDKKRESVIIAEHILEVRHEASGTFLDVRGYVADYIRKEHKFLPHWGIDSNVVNFKDTKKALKKKAALLVIRAQDMLFSTPRQGISS